jgi:hypothetical protein
MKFRRVDKIDHGSCTVSLWLWKGKKRGRILRPKKQKGGRVVTELLPQLGDVAAEDALKLAVWLSEAIAYPLAVFDPEHLWEKRWERIIFRQRRALQTLGSWQRPTHHAEHILWR